MSAVNPFAPVSAEAAITEATELVQRLTIILKTIEEHTPNVGAALSDQDAPYSSRSASQAGSVWSEATLKRRASTDQFADSRHHMCGCYAMCGKPQHSLSQCSSDSSPSVGDVHVPTVGEPATGTSPSPSGVPVDTSGDAA